MNSKAAWLLKKLVQELNIGKFNIKQQNIDFVDTLTGDCFVNREISIRIFLEETWKCPTQQSQQQ